MDVHLRVYLLVRPGGAASAQPRAKRSDALGLDAHGSPRPDCEADELANKGQKR